MLISPSELVEAISRLREIASRKSDIDNSDSLVFSGDSAIAYHDGMRRVVTSETDDAMGFAMHSRDAGRLTPLLTSLDPDKTSISIEENELLISDGTTEVRTQISPRSAKMKLGAQNIGEPSIQVDALELHTAIQAIIAQNSKAENKSTFIKTENIENDCYLYFRTSISGLSLSGEAEAHSRCKVTALGSVDGILSKGLSVRRELLSRSTNAGSIICIAAGESALAFHENVGSQSIATTMDARVSSA